MRINRSNDYLFKRIFGSDEGKDVLLSFLNAVLKSPPGRELTTVNLLDREQDPAYLLDRSARLDILASTEDGTIINIEVQIANEHNIAKRTMYYWASLYHEQLPEGKTFIELCRTITINILSFNWFQDDQRYHRTFHVRDDTTGELLNDDLEIHFMELRKIEGVKHSPQDAIEAWMMYLNNLEGEEMEAIAMDNPGIKKALTIEQAFMRNKQERRIYELREKAIKDELSARLGSEAKGRAEGRAEMAQEAICKFLEVRFGKPSLNLQQRVKRIDKLETLDRIINKIYAAGSLEEAADVIDIVHTN
jgi:predicted transposase/invertase (TIGR01784 family)